MENNGVSVIIPVKDRFNDLEKCVTSIYYSILSHQKENPLHDKFEIIIIDDHSENDISKINSINKYIKIIKNNGIGPGAARNTGIKNANHSFIGFIDSDCVASKDWISILIKSLTLIPEYILQGDPTLFQKTNNNKFGKYEELLYKGLFKTYLNSHYCFQVDTRNCAIKKELMQVFRENVFIEDMKQAQAEARVLGKDLNKKGIKIVYEPKLIVYHKDPPSLREAMIQKARHGSGRIYLWERTPSLKYFFIRYFWNPIFNFGVPFWYVIPTHLAFISGYFKAKRNMK